MTPSTPEPPRRLVPKPTVFAHLEAAIANRIAIHPNWISLGKLVVITPLVLATVGISGRAADLGLGLLLATFVVLDYLDGVVARGQGLDTKWGRILDRVTDYPLLVGLSVYCADVLPTALLAAKLALDGLLLILFLLGKGSTENRIRTTFSYAILWVLLGVGRQWPGDLYTTPVAEGLLLGGITFSSVVALFNLRIFSRRNIATFLSMANLMCGIGAIVCASQHRFGLALLLSLIGAGFDGFDGAAARRWGSIRYGVLADDIADGVNFALAPAVALIYGIGGPEGMAIGIAYAALTISRLVYFTLRKDAADPSVFEGAPSTIGSIVVLSSLVLFEGSPGLVGALAGITMAQMVSFSTTYRHLGRWLQTARVARIGAGGLGVGLAGLTVGFGPQAAATILLGAGLLYSFLPMVQAFRTAKG